MLSEFFDLVQQSAGVFAFDDPTDDQVTGQPLFVGDGITSIYQAVRTFGTTYPFTERITLLNTVSAVYYNGIAQTGFSYDVSTGLITCAAPAGVGVIVTADFTYYFRCRFSDDTQEFTNFALDLWQLGMCKIQSVPFWRYA